MAQPRRYPEIGELLHRPGQSQVQRQETLLVFDNVFVPWRRSFFIKRLNSRTDSLPFCGAVIASPTGLQSRVSDVLIGAVKLLAEYNGLDKMPHIKDKILDMVRLTETFIAAALPRGLRKQDRSGFLLCQSTPGQRVQAECGRPAFEMARLAVDVTGGSWAPCVRERPEKPGDRQVCGKNT